VPVAAVFGADATIVLPGTMERGWSPQGTLSEGEDSVQLTSFLLTSLDQLVLVIPTLFTFFLQNKLP
jgi:hypothetical protein